MDVCELCCVVFVLCCAACWHDWFCRQEFTSEKAQRSGSRLTTTTVASPLVPQAILDPLYFGSPFAPLEEQQHGGRSGRAGGAAGGAAAAAGCGGEGGGGAAARTGAGDAELADPDHAQRASFGARGAEDTSLAPSAASSDSSSGQDGSSSSSSSGSDSDSSSSGSSSSWSSDDSAGCGGFEDGAGGGSDHDPRVGSNATVGVRDRRRTPKASLMVHVQQRRQRRQAPRLEQDPVTRDGHHDHVLQPQLGAAPINDHLSTARASTGVDATSPKNKRSRADAAAGACSRDRAPAAKDGLDVIDKDGDVADDRPDADANAGKGDGKKSRLSSRKRKGFCEMCDESFDDFASVGSQARQQRGSLTRSVLMFDWLCS